MVVDVEWGAFGDNGCLAFLSQDVDKEVDRKSLLAKSFTCVLTFSLFFVRGLWCQHLARLSRLFVQY